MENYKNLLAERLSNAVQAECIYYEENDNGDYPRLTRLFFPK